MVRRRNTRWEDMDRSNIDLSVLIRHYEVHNRTEGKSPRTVQWYNEVLSMFYGWLESQGMSTILNTIGEMEVRGFILHVQSRPGLKGLVSPNTVNNRVRALRAFFAWLNRKGYTKDHVLKDVRPPKMVTKVIEPLTTEEIKRMFATMNPNTAMGARNTALYSLMLDTGLRLSEVAHLEEVGVHIEERYVKVLGKGSKERIVAFGGACQRSLLHYYHHFRPEPAHPGVETFFLSIDGYSLAPDGIRALTTRLAKSAGVPRLHVHLLRHTYATHFLLNGGDVFLLKQNLGHSSLFMVEHYLHIASQTAAIRSQSFSPLDRMNVKDSRRFRHGFSPGSMNGQIYPNAGRTHSRSGRRSKPSGTGRK